MSATGKFNKYSPKTTKAVSINCSNRFLGLALSVFLLLAFMWPASAQDPSPGVRCVVLDPGHGGHDNGCMSKDRKWTEKNIVLSVALKLGKIIEEEHPDVKVVYTRKKDVFIPLAERADIANRNKADLFISIHVNANPSSAPYGCETYTMGAHVSDRNFEVSKRENAVIKMEDDYTSKYEGFNPDSPESYIIFSLLQNAHSEQSIKLASFIQDEYRKGPVTHNRGVKQAGFLVLWRTTMPSVLTEIGFLSNLKDKAILITSEGQQKIARRLADAFTRYCNDYAQQNQSSVLEPGKDSESAENQDNKEQENLQSVQDTSYNETTAGQTFDNPSGADDAAKSTKTTKSAGKEGVTYAIQIMASKKKLGAGSTEFKRLTPVARIYDRGFYKYCYGSFSTRQEAALKLPQVKKKFKDAFVVEIKNGKIAGR